MKAKQMIPKNLYRIGEYRISEFADGRLWWDAHCGFGKQAGGQCFIYGNILMMGARCTIENGFLKSEFLDKLKRLPLWNKTRHYCFASVILDVTTGRNIRDDRFPLLVSSPGKPSVGSKTINAEKMESFRLWQYKITCYPDGQISWKSLSGTSRIIGGFGIIESDVLFLKPNDYDEPQASKRDFLHTLLTLPNWDRTTFWCRSLALKPVLQEINQTPRLPLQKIAKLSGQMVKSASKHKPNYISQLCSKMDCCLNACAEVLKARWAEGTRPRREKKKMD